MYRDAIQFHGLFIHSVSQSVSHQKSSLFTVPHPHLCRQLQQQVQYAAARIRIGRSGRSAWAHPSQAHLLLLPPLLCTAWDLLGAPAPATANPSPHSPAPPLNSTKPSREEPNRAKTKAKQTQGGQRTEPKAKRKPAEAAKSPRHLPIPPKFPCIPFPSSLPTHLLLLLLRVSSPAPTSVPLPLSLFAGRHCAPALRRVLPVQRGSVPAAGMMPRRVASVPVPDWLEALLATRFFLACAAHPASPRNECNMFCLDCTGAPPPPPPAFCYYCRAHRHSSHRVIQVYLPSSSGGGGGAFLLLPLPSPPPTSLPYSVDWQCGRPAAREPAS